MGKFVYATYNNDSFFGEGKNEFHYFYMLLGMFLVSKEKYSENLSKYNLYNRYLFDEMNFRWRYVNKGQKYLRKLINEIPKNEVSKNAKIYRKEIRKLGYSGPESRPAYPKKGDIIAKKIFELLNDNEFKEFYNNYITYLREKWENNVAMEGFLHKDNSPEKCVTVTIRNFCGFQMEVFLQHKNEYYEFTNTNENYFKKLKDDLQ